MPRLSLLVSLLSLLLMACSGANATTASPTGPPATPTPFGTVLAPTLPPPVGEIRPTATSPPRQCIFPHDLGDNNGVIEIGVYRLIWQGAPVTINTRSGPIEVSGPSSLAFGLRNIVIAHNGPIPSELRLTEQFTPGSTMLLLLAQGVQESRLGDGQRIVQAIDDPLDDVRGLAPNLDIVRVERFFGNELEYVLRVTLATATRQRIIYTYETIEALVGNERYAVRIYPAENRQLSLAYDASGEVSDWLGAIVIQGPTVTWTLNSGADQPFGARTSTSATNGDTTNLFPITLVNSLFETTRRNCGL